MKQKTIHLARAAMTLLLVMLCTMGAWAAQTPVSLSDDGAGGWFINMPAKGTATSVANAAVLTLTADDISAGKIPFKLYDDGGKDGGDDVKTHDLGADAPQLADVPDIGNAADDGEENQGHDNHLNQPQEDIAHRLQE